MTRCKPLVTLKSRKARSDFARKKIKKTWKFVCLWTHKTKMSLLGREKAGEGEKQLVNIKHDRGRERACMAATRTKLLVFTDDVTADRSSRVITLLRFIQLLQKRLDGAPQSTWIMSQTILQKQPQNFSSQRNGIYPQWPSLSSDLNTTCNY